MSPPAFPRHARSHTLPPSTLLSFLNLLCILKIFYLNYLQGRWERYEAELEAASTKGVLSMDQGMAQKRQVGAWCLALAVCAPMLACKAISGEGWCKSIHGLVGNWVVSASRLGF